MVLSDSAILKSIENGDIIINPFNSKHINPNSVDLTLDNIINTYKNHKPLDPRSYNEVITTEIPEEGIVLFPGTIYLASTIEKAGSTIYHSQLKGKSSLARLGIFIDCTASWGDTGFINNWTLEISVVEPVKIYPSMRICQIIFTEVKGEVLVPYNKKPDSKYNGDNRAKESLYYKNYNEK
jgi:dCTP deaminase